MILKIIIHNNIKYYINIYTKWNDNKYDKLFLGYYIYIFLNIYKNITSKK